MFVLHFSLIAQSGMVIRWQTLYGRQQCGSTKQGQRTFVLLHVLFTMYCSASHLLLAEQYSVHT